MVLERPGRLAFFPVQDQQFVSLLRDNLCSKASNNHLFYYHFKLYYTVKVNLLRETKYPVQMYSYFSCFSTRYFITFVLPTVKRYFSSCQLYSCFHSHYGICLSSILKQQDIANSLWHPLFCADSFPSAELVFTCHLPFYGDHFTHLHPSF